jgi:ankyrin repeat protein
MKKAYGYKVIRQLLSNGADVDSTDNEKSTPLHFAAERRHIEIIRE